MTEIKNICIYGASSDNIDKSYKMAAEKLGRMLAENEIGMIFGGGATGLMGAAARGHKSVKGNIPIIGVAPKFFDEPGVLYDYCTSMIWTDTMHQRKQKMEELADAFIVLPGGIGTFEEFFEVYTLRQLKQHNKKIVLYNVNGYYDSIKSLLKLSVKEGFLAEQCLDMCYFADTAEKVMYIIKSGI